MATYHILNGDCLAEQLTQTSISQNLIVFRECLIDGNVYATDMVEFWDIRARYIADTHNASTETYFTKTVAEFEKIDNLPDDAEVCLWFEDDLFCQTNLWFILSRLVYYPRYKLFRIFPQTANGTGIWKGFGAATAKTLEQAYASRVEFSSSDVRLGAQLWAAYQTGEVHELVALSKTPTSYFRYLTQVCQAQVDRFPTGEILGRPDAVVREIISYGSTDFQTVLSQFTEREGIYGFGDTQIKQIYDRQMSNQK